ncbi:SH3 domain-containing protein [uncultured Anaerococcus sp.]|uniref:SH3 domain-containing protein n=1 Tax=uncultured Anaerococcus sp. TaxID=293428 RepID=UPI0025EAB112|nr:SH3 domain-containing protein [uncultured Anaerococcus sp.]
MKKLKILLALGLVILLSSCQDDSYVSVRHPQGEENQVVEKTSPEEKNKEETDLGKEVKDEKNLSSDLEEGVEIMVKDTVNMRLAPSENSAVVAEVGPDDEILNLGETEGWTRVTVNGKTGYIRNDLLIKK